MPESLLEAEHFHWEGNVGMAEGSAEHPVRFESGTNRVTARKIQIDTVARTVAAQGTVIVERQTEVVRYELRSSVLPRRSHREMITESLRGDDFFYDFQRRQGKLNNARVRLANFNISTSDLIINGQRYIAHNVVIRPGGLTDEEERIYGRPHVNLRAKEAIVDTGDKGSPLAVTGAGVYYDNFRLLPVPSHVFRASGVGRSSRTDRPYQIVPRLAYNSVDGALLTANMRFALDRQHPQRLAINADLGASARIGFRGGGSLDYTMGLGTLSLRGRKNDIVTTQLTNRIVVDREPEFELDSTLLPLMPLPGKRRAGLAFVLGAGRYKERTIGSNSGIIDSSRQQAIVAFTTRYNDVDGPYLELFAGISHYSLGSTNYRNTGFEVGYDGNVSRYLRGQFSYRSTSIAGTTPFRFDAVEIARELRTTFDINLSKRYIVPIDLRYDLDLGRLRDERVGLLRSYKTFAYGFSYQTARHELRLDLRQAF
jgi:hypothetical protein